MKGVDAVARILQREGVEYLFSYPNNPLIDAAAAIGIRPIIARSEKTLINMADGYSRATNGRRPAVVRRAGRAGHRERLRRRGPGLRRLDPDADHPGRPRPAPPAAPAEFDPLPTYSHVTKWAGARSPSPSASRS